MKVDFVDVVDRVDCCRSAVVEWCKDAVMWFLMLRPVSAIARVVKYGVVQPLRRGGAG